MDINLAINKSIKYASVLVCLCMLSSCKKDNEKKDYPAGTNENINTWILDSLKRYYYWNENLPRNPNIGDPPQSFFNSVRNIADRFSYIVLPSDPSTVAPNNRAWGFDYATVQETTSGQIIGVVKLVLSDSPASRAGIKRGDYFNQINGKQITALNAQALQAEIFNNNKFSLSLVTVSNGILTPVKIAELSKGVIPDQRPLTRIIENAAKKIGYISFNDFPAGTASALNSSFVSFKTAAISELIIDLRYNSGGQVAEAAGLCALIAQGVNFNTPFITYKGNKNGGTFTESLGTCATSDRTVNFNQLVQNNLALSKVYILSTAATASAAEVVINNLKPYMQVVLIGTKTRGKDEASFRIFDARNPKQVQWEMHPIVYKLFNASGGGNYSEGISPDITIDEFSALPLMPLGDENEPLIKAAMSRISGAAVQKVVKSTGSAPVSFAGKVIFDTGVEAAGQSTVITHH